MATWYIIHAHTNVKLGSVEAGNRADATHLAGRQRPGVPFRVQSKVEYQLTREEAQSLGARTPWGKRKRAKKENRR